MCPSHLLLLELILDSRHKITYYGPVLPITTVLLSDLERRKYFIKPKPKKVFKNLS